MRRPRAGRRTWDPRVRLATVPAAAVGASAGSVLVFGWSGLVIATLVGVFLCRWVLTTARSLRAESLDIDSAIVGRTLHASRQASDEERRIIQNASHSVRSSVQRTLELLRAALRAQSAVVLWTRSSDQTVRVREAETCSDHLRGGVFDARAGILAELRRDATLFDEIDGIDGRFPWYEPGHEPGSAIAVALVRDGVPLGYLVVDRARGDIAFDDVDLIAVRSAAEQVSLAIHMEFLVLEAAAASRDIAALDTAASQLNHALTVDEVCGVARDILEQFTEFDFFAVTEASLENSDQRVVFADGVGSESVRDAEFETGDDLASRAVRYGESLPYDGRIAEPGTTPVLGANAIPHARSVLVFPLTMPQGTIGTLTIASAHADAFSDVPRNLFGILVNHVAAALSNAMAYSRMVRMATTDGMTGLTNHRTFKERGAEALARANRSRRPLSLILTDIDHFKQVNDTHGHAVGDEVIKGVADVLASSARDVDVTARYGGEEFAVLLEDTDADTAERIAERIREKVKMLTFEGAHGPFGVTISMGVAEYVDSTIACLVDEADQGLYAAKRGGRDRVVRFHRTDIAAA